MSKQKTCSHPGCDQQAVFKIVHHSRSYYFCNKHTKTYYDKLLEGRNLSKTQSNILDFVKNSRDPVSVFTVSKNLNITKQKARYNLKRLTELGFLGCYKFGVLNKYFPKGDQSV